MAHLQAVAVFMVLLSSVALSASQSCGTLNCTQEYDDDCEPDISSVLYDNCKTSQSNCTDPIGPADNLSVDCYETCIVGNPFDPTDPFQCCADPVLESGEISLTTDPNFIIARLYSPNEPGTSNYRLNTYCKYNIQCPNDNYNLHYLMIRFDIEPSDNGTCLDFLRFDFTATGTNVPTDACGKLEDLPNVLKGGAHGSGLTLDFRSNRINRTKDFFLSVICLNTAPSRKRAVQSLSLTPILKEPVDPNLQRAVPTLEPTVTEELFLPQEMDCTPSQSFSSIVGRDVSNTKLTSAVEYFDHVFPRERQSQEMKYITVTRAGVVRYSDNTITVVEWKGKSFRILYKFENIKVLQVFNRIEGYLTFPGGSSPRGRTFPGYGFLQFGQGVAQYIQTLVDPRFLLSDEEMIIVRELFKELFNRQQFDAERFYFAPPLERTTQRVNCDINTLAELNIRSCSPVVKAVATFFLGRVANQDLCYSKG